MDVVYVNKIGIGANAEELRYSLRSLINIPHDNVFIVGDSPSWARSVTSLRIEQLGPEHDEYIKQINIARNLSAACHNPRVSDDFIYMNDDFFIMKPVSIVSLQRHRGTTDAAIKYHAKYFNSESSYFHAMKLTDAELLNRGFVKPLNYELHIPFIVNKTKYLNLLEEFKDIFWTSPTCLSQWRTIYGNYYKIGGRRMDDVKIHDDGVSEITLKESEFLSGADENFNNTILANYIKNIFAKKSKYEIQSK